MTVNTTLEHPTPSKSSPGDMNFIYSQPKVPYNQEDIIEEVVPESVPDDQDEIVTSVAVPVVTAEGIPIESVIIDIPDPRNTEVSAVQQASQTKRM